MDIPLFRKLLEEQQISATDFDNVVKNQNRPTSVYTDVTTLLYTGVLLLATALGILIYKNIDTLGHTVITAAIAFLCIMAYAYCGIKSSGYSNRKTPSPNVYFDYILLSGCLLLLTLTGYLQFEYRFFGNYLGLATFIPMVLLFITAYYFDHIGVLSMAITNLAAWAGLTVAPQQVIKENDFQDIKLICTALILGGALLAISYFSRLYQVKAHFANTYKNFGTHILFISLLAALFNFPAIYLLSFGLLALLTIFYSRKAIEEGSFYFFVVSLVYGYIGLSYVACTFLWKLVASDASLFLTFIYFIASGIALIRILLTYNKTLKKNGDL